MKKNFNLLKFGGRTVAFLFASLVAFSFVSCTNLLDSKNQGGLSVEQEALTSESGTFKINLANKNTRYIAAADYRLTDITNWTVTFTEELESGSSATAAVYSLNTKETVSGASTPSVSYDDTERVLNVKLIPTGTYTISLSGTGSDSDGTNSYTVFGSKSGVSVYSDASKNSATILVGLAKTENGTGGLSLSLTDSGSALSNYTSSLIVTLQSITDDTKTYSSSGESASLTATYLDSTLTVTGSSIASGWYKITFYVNDSLKVSIPNDYVMVEIADGITTTATSTISVASVKKYYATNESSSYNGLATVSRANLTTLLKRIAENLPDEGEIDIYVDEVPEVDVEAITSLKTLFAESTSKSLVIYKDNEIAAALKISTDTSSTSVVTSLKISNALTLSASTSATNKTLAVDTLSEPNDGDGLTLTLKNGATISTNSKITSLRLYAVDSTGAKDNWSAYVASPFITENVYDYSGKISLYEYGETEVSTNYAVTTATVTTQSTTTDGSVTTYSYYTKPASSANISATNFSSSVGISAALASVEGSSYISNTAIPYDDDTLTFTITMTSEISGTPTSYAWYLNGTSLALINSSEEAETSSTSFNPQTTSLVDVDGENTVSCYVLLDGTMYLTEMTFTFSTAARSAAVWFNGVDMTSTYTYFFYQLADDTNTSATATELISGLSISPLYCFDGNRNLWTVESTYDSETQTNTYYLKKYKIVNSTGLCSTTAAASITLTSDGQSTNLTTRPADITYADNCIYVLCNDSSSSTSTIYAYSIINEPFFANGYSFSTSTTVSGTTVTINPSQIAVNDSTVYIAAASAVNSTITNCNIYKATIDVGSTEENSTTTVETFVASDTLTAQLTGYDSTLHNSSYDGITITDLQLGDGLGNNTDKLYVLVREYTNSMSNSNSTTQDSSSNYCIYSRGALVSINTSTSSDISVNGWSNNSSNYTELTGYSFNFYAPESSSSTVYLYGPTYFAAVVPKKLVILDDGFTIGDYDSTNADYKVENKDSIVEFDIEGSAGLTRGISVSATRPSTSTGFTTTD